MNAVKSINHIGIAVKSIEDQRAFYEGVLGAEFESIETVEDQKVRVGIFKVGDVRLELLEPTSEDSSVAKFIEKRGEGLHHIAYTVDDLPCRIAAMKIEGIRMIDDQPRTGAHNMRIAFMHPKSSGGVLTELCEPKK